MKAREVFEFESVDGSEWWKVKLALGKSGCMHSSRIRFHATMADLRDVGPESEVSQYGKSHGIEYYPLAQSAAKGDAKAMKKFFAVDDTDGAAAETHFAVLGTIIHLLGDDRLAKFLADQSPSYRAKVAESIYNDFTLYPFRSGPYMTANFPKTAKVLAK